MDPAINDPAAELETPPPPPEDAGPPPAADPPPTELTEFAEDVAGGPVRADEPPTIKPIFEPPFSPADVDQTVRHGGSPGVRVKHMGFLTEPVRANSLPQLGGRVVPEEILAEVQRLLTADTVTDLSELRHAVLELLAPWLPPPAG